MMRQRYGRVILSLFISLLCSVQLFAQSGKDGVKTIASPGTVVNDYTFLTFDATSGATSISVAGNVLGNGFPAALNQGDLIFIVQMQGATMSSFDDPTYGNIISYNNCGNSEFAEVLSTSGANTISLSCGLQYNYSSAGRVQIVRVPRYSTLTVNSGASITCPGWGGNSGGVIAIEVSGVTTLNGSIDASGKGFRGGSLFDNNSAYGVLNWRWPTDDYGAEKGESIAGTITDYDGMGGRYCKGAPANGGGGGSGHNCGGGGGANAGTIAYDGHGCPDVSNASWAAAWNLEYAGFATTLSSGGGKGGYSFSSSNQNALSVGPFNSAWGGDQRRDNGGRGGRPLDYSTGRIFMGGGGGAGEQNDSKGGRGGSGGGIIAILSYNAISGSGQITANGENGFNALTNNGTDGAGGGGGGGCVQLNTSNSTAVVIHADGGNGGSQTLSAFNQEAEGPGGGGSGGFIALTSGSPSRFTNGGTNGTTNSFSLTEFPPNGATKGGGGINNASLALFRLMPYAVNICSGNSTTLNTQAVGTPPSGAVFGWYDQATGGTLLGSGTSYTTPILTSNQVYYVGVCPGVSRIAINVNVSNGMTASISSTGSCSGTPISFTGTGSASVTSWLWDFGDNTAPSSSQNPTHNYSTGGTYTVVLTVGDGTCTISVSQNVTINTNPVSNFTSSATGTQCGSTPIQFTNSSTGATGYFWNFGDGSPLSTQPNPTHTYSASGTYSVVLTASNGSCTSSHSLSVTIGTKPLSSFSTSVGHCAGDVIQFTNLSNGNGSPIISWSWNFGDGSPLSSIQNPSHAFASGGIFNVSLRTNTSTCFDDTIISIIITATPVVNFSSSSSNGCVPQIITFNNSTTGFPTYNWNFGDGSTHSTQQNPSHTYSASGTYTVTLIAIQNGCSDTLINPNMISIANTPTASYSSVTGICLSDSLHLTNASTGNGSPITSYSWDFGDGSPLSSATNPVHVFAGPGNYSVHLTASNGTCTDDTIRTINVTPGPVAAFSTPVTSACGSLNASFTNSTSGSATFTWNFGDGSPVSNVTSPSHNYSIPGIYTVTLIAAQGSCSDTLIQNNYITVANSPLSSFSSALTCLGDSTHFNDLSAGNGQPITSYSWTFGDGGTSTSSDPSHLYGLSGTYNVQLTVNNGGCSDDTTIQVNVSAAPTVSFASNINSACDSATVTFTNTSTGALSYLWSFGDGDTSHAVSPTHSYNTAGSYSITLTASNSNCSITQTKFNQVVIHSSPVITLTASKTSLCKGDCISFNGPAGLTSWSWTFNGASPPNAGNQNPVSVCYSGPGNYDVTLTGSNGFCTATQTQPAYIHVVDCSTAPRSSFICSDTAFCSNSCIDFVDLSSNAQTWQWSFPGASPSSSNIEHPSNICYSQSGTYDVTLVTTNPVGSDTLHLTNFVNVTSGPSTPVITQAGNTLTATAAVQYQWYLNNIEIQGANSQQYMASLSGDYFVVISDNNGCTSSSAEMHVSLVGIEEFENNLSFSVYPNPVNDRINIELKSLRPIKLTLFLTDALGQKLFIKVIPMNSNVQIVSYPVGNLTSGIYFLHIFGDDHQWVKTVVKN